MDIFRTCDNGIKPFICTPGMVADIKNKGIQDSALQVVLFNIRLDTHATFAPDLASVNIGSECIGTKVCTSEQETTGAHKRVIDQFSGRSQRLVCHDQR